MDGDTLEQPPLPGVVGAEAASQFQCDLYLYWRAVASAGELPLGARRYVTRAGLRRMRESMAQYGGGASDGESADEPHDPRLLFMRRLLERLGLLREQSPTKLIAHDRSEVERFYALPFAERLRVCARLWVAGGWWSDRVDATREPPRLLAPAPTRVALARRRTLDLLLEVASGAALAVPRPPLAVSGRMPSAGAATRTDARARGAAKRPVQSAAAPDEETAREALLGPLCWLGFVALDGASVGLGVHGARLCRPTAAAAALRAHAAEASGAPLVEAAGPVIVQSSFEVVALPPLAAPVLLTLDTCAQPRGSGQAARYTLNREAFARARRGGWRAGEVASRLERLAGSTLPQNIQVTLADWDRQAERVRLRRHVEILEVRDGTVLDALLADPHAAPWVERRLAPTLALLQAGKADAARSWLLRHDELPAVVAVDAPEASPGDPRPPGLR
jgi:hypothetical protein